MTKKTSSSIAALPLVRETLLAALVPTFLLGCSSSSTAPAGEEQGTGGASALIAVGDPVDVDGDGMIDGFALDENGDGVVDSYDANGDGVSDGPLTSPVAGTGGGAGTGGNGVVVGAGGSAAGTGGGTSVGTGGTSGGSGYTCPAGSDALVAQIAGKTASAVGTVPAPATDNWFLEGPVWIGDSLYVSQIRDYGPVNPAHILKYTPGGTFASFISDVGTNGLAVNAAGLLVAASHKVGGIVTIDPANPSAAPVTLIDSFGGARFNSPNDLTIRSDGTIYFTDPDWQSPDPNPQPIRGVYRVPPGGAAELLTVLQDNPNGIALSPDETTLYVGGNSLASYPVNPDGTIGTGTAFGQGFNGSTDGLGMDCAGNLYVTSGGGVQVFSSAGASLGTISAQGQTTNVAFGGPTNTTLFITGFGSPGTLTSVELNVPGYPY